MPIWRLIPCFYWCWCSIYHSQPIIALYPHRRWLQLWRLRLCFHWCWCHLRHLKLILALYTHWGWLTIWLPITPSSWFCFQFLLLPTNPSTLTRRGRLQVWIHFIIIFFVPPWGWSPVWCTNPDYGLISPQDYLPILRLGHADCFSVFPDFCFCCPCLMLLSSFICCLSTLFEI